MSKGALIESVAKQFALSNKSGKPLSKAAVGRIVDSVFSTTAKQIAETGYFRYPGFGSFSIRNRAERKAYKHLPKTKGEQMDKSAANTITVPASTTVGFKPSATLKETVKGQKRVKRTKRSSTAKEQEIA